MNPTQYSSLCVYIMTLYICMATGKQSSGASIVVEDIGDGDKQPTRSTLKTRSSLEPVKEIHELEDDGYELKDEPSWVGYLTTSSPMMPWASFGHHQIDSVVTRASERKHS